MHRAFWRTGLLAFSFLPASAAPQDIAELDEHLQFLEPLIGRRWEGGYVGENSPELVISLRFEPVLSGKAVKYTREAAELGYTSETHFYRSPGRGEVLFLRLNSRGIVGEGAAWMEDGEIVLRGVDHWPDGPVESKTVWNLGENGVLRDTFTRFEEGEWVPGHIQEFTLTNGMGMAALNGAPDSRHRTAESPQEPTVTDVEGNTYHTAVIGDQVWLVENLRTTRFNDGSVIPFVPDQPEWSRLSTGGFCKPAHSSEEGVLFGLLYNYHAVDDSRGLCPDGWHVPDIAEWELLIEYLGGPEVAGREMKDTGSGTWEVAVPGMNSGSGFSAIPAGGRGQLGSAGEVGFYATWWASTTHDSIYAWHFGLHPDRHSIRSNPGHKASGFSVRCVQDAPRR